MVDELARKLKAHCQNKPEKWRHVVGICDYFLPSNFFIQPHPKFLYQFVDNVPLNCTDHQSRSIMHVTAFFGEPVICRLFMDMGARAISAIRAKHVLHFAANGRVSPENVVELLDTLWALDPKGCNRTISDSYLRNKLLDDAMISENYFFYLEILKRGNQSYSSRLALMKEPHDMLEESSEYKHIEKDYYTLAEKKSERTVPSLTNMCMSIAKLHALTYSSFRKKMKELLPAVVLQLFVDCLPISEFSPRLLEFFGGCPGVKVDVRQQYWSIYQRELVYRLLSDSRFEAYFRFTNLVSVYDNLHKFQHPPKDKYDNPKIVKRVFENYRPYSGPSVVPFDQFKTAFTKFTNKLFDGYDWSHTLVIGGSVISSLMVPSKGSNPFKHSDIDICFYDLSDAHFIVKVRDFIEFVKKKFGYVLVLSTYECIELCLFYPNRRIQIMKRLWNSIESILMHVDIDCTGVGFNGTQVLATPRAVLALNRCWSVATQMHYAVRGPLTYENRLIKYAYRGFTIVDFNFPMDIDLAPIIQRYFTKYKDKKLQPYITEERDILGMALIITVEAFGNMNYDIWERCERERDLPKISKEWTPKKIRDELEKGKMVYFSDGHKQAYYQSKYTPVSLKSNLSRYRPIPNPKGKHYVQDYFYRDLKTTK